MSQLNVDDIYNNAGTGAANFPKGATVTGVVTATSFSGSGASLTGIADTNTIAAASLTVSGITTYYGDIQLQNGVGVGNSVTWDASANSLIFKDKSYAKFGDGSDLVIHHDSSNSYITNATGNLNIQAKITEDSIIAKADDAVELYFNGGKKLETTNTGAVITGIATATTQLEVGSTIQAEAASGIVTATTFVSSDRFISLGNRRINMNGAMQVWQKATSASSVGGSNGYFAADRYRSSNNGSGRHTISRDTDEPGGFNYSMKIDVTTAVASPSANNYTFIQHRMTGSDVQPFAKGTSSAQKYALSFWVKSPKTGVHVVQLEDVENSRSVQGSYTIASADTWEKHTIIFPAETSNGITGDNSHRMQLYFWLFAGSTYNNGNVASLGTTWASTGSISRASGQVNVFDNTSNNFYITGIQFEVGSYATPFEHALYDDELRKCQVYFNMIGDGTNFGQNKALSDAFMWGTTECDFMYTFPTEMRSTPSLYQVTGSNYFRIQGGGSDTYIDGTFTQQYGCKRTTSQYAASDGSRTAGDSCHITLVNSAARYGYTAEL